MSNQEAKTEKRSAALSSVVYAVILTTIKLIVGLLTNSLGILAEASHSGLDLVAAAATYFAVRVSDKPADKEHLLAMAKSKIFRPFLRRYFYWAHLPGSSISPSNGYSSLMFKWKYPSGHLSSWVSP